MSPPPPPPPPHTYVIEAVVPGLRHASTPLVPAGSPSHGGDVAVYVFDISQPNVPTPFFFFFLSCSCVYFCLYGPFNRISVHETSRHLCAFSHCFSGLISALLVLSTIYLFMKVSFSPEVILCGWLCLKAPINQLTDRPTDRPTDRLTNFYTTERTVFHTKLIIRPLLEGSWVSEGCFAVMKRMGWTPKNSTTTQDFTAFKTWLIDLSWTHSPQGRRTCQTKCGEGRVRQSAAKNVSASEVRRMTYHLAKCGERRISQQSAANDVSASEVRRRTFQLAR